MMWFVLVGCIVEDEAPAPECMVPAFVDADGDGFGGEEAGFLCAPREGFAFVDGDCDDEDPGAFPGADEVCDQIDNDCDGVVDDGFEVSTWFPDLDEDGFGNRDAGVESCAQPDPTMILEGGDCNDLDPAQNPSAIEVCNGIDDDCDSFADDEDEDILPESLSAYFLDLDGDGYGDPATELRQCEPLPDYVLNNLDCNDIAPLINPEAAETCDNVDNDCNGLADEADPNLGEDELVLLSCDLDADGFGSPTEECLACEATVGIAVDDQSDCDDFDPLATVVQDWYVDADGDGVGAGDAMRVQCLNPNAELPPPEDQLVPEAFGIDCDPTDGTIYPGALDPLGDGVDQDCDGMDG